MANKRDNPPIKRQNANTSDSVFVSAISANGRNNLGMRAASDLNFAFDAETRNKPKQTGMETTIAAKI
jgi:hypothetical protein